MATHAASAKRKHQRLALYRQVKRVFQMQHHARLVGRFKRQCSN